MRVGYGFKRREADFADLQVDRLFLDSADSERGERTVMLHGGLRGGDTLVLLARGDLAPGKTVHTIVGEVEKIGAEIEINEPIRPRGRPGPKPSWEPSSPEQDARLKRLWKDLTQDGPYVVRLACEDAGVEANDDNRALFRSRLVRRYGTRAAK